MFDVFGSVKGLLKLDQVCIDNNIFRLHYKATVIILIAFSLLVTSRQYIGDPIDCIVDEIPLNVMDTYCWIYSTFTIPNRLTGVVGKDIVQPGVGSHTEGEDEVKYHKYYQWVCFVLFFQGSSINLESVFIFVAKQQFSEVLKLIFSTFLSTMQPFAFMCRATCGRHGRVDASKC